MWRRILVWGGLAAVVLTVAAIALLPRCLGSDTARERLEAILGEALGREVAIEAIEVSSDAPVVELLGVTVAQPEELAVEGEGPLLRAERIRLEMGLEALLDRRVVGLATASGVTVNVLERGGRTSVHGLGRQRKEVDERSRKSDLAVDLELTDVALRLVDLDRNESIDVRDVELRGHLSNDAATEGADREAVATLTAEAIEVRGVVLRELTVQMRLEESAVELVRLSAGLDERGVIEGSGRLGLAGTDAGGRHDWSVALSLRDAALDGALRDLAATLVPTVVQATASGGEPTTGWLDASVRLRGRGLRWTTILPSLVGDASVELRDVVVPAGASLLELAALAGRERGPWALGGVKVSLGVREGWLYPGTLSLGELVIAVEGRASVDGKLELRVDLMPLVQVFGGGVYATVSRTTTKIPVRIVGTVDHPELAPPRARDVAAGLLGGAVRRALGPKDEP